MTLATVCAADTDVPELLATNVAGAVSWSVGSTWSRSTLPGIDLLLKDLHHSIQVPSLPCHFSADNISLISGGSLLMRTNVMRTNVSRLPYDSEGTLRAWSPRTWTPTVIASPWCHGVRPQHRCPTMAPYICRFIVAVIIFSVVLASYSWNFAVRQC